MNLGPAEVLIILGLVVLPLLAVLALVDAAVHPNWAWEEASQNKTLWVVLLVVGLFLSLVGTVLALIYLFGIRPQVVRAQHAR